MINRCKLNHVHKNQEEQTGMSFSFVGVSSDFRLKRSITLLLVGLGVSALLLTICLFISISLGAADITLGEIWKAIFAFDQNLTSHLIIRTVRLPRSLTGAAVATAGTIGFVGFIAPHISHQLIGSSHVRIAAYGCSDGYCWCLWQIW
jgi:ABC-type Fe3+-siderophore transport system permease subunit